MNLFLKSAWAGLFFALSVGVSASTESETVSADQAIERRDVGLDLTAPLGEAAKALPENAVASALEISPKATAPALYPEPHRAFIFESEPADFSEASYASTVEALLASYEKNTGRKLVPTEKKKVALKVYTASGRGLATPKALTRAVRTALERRGFARENIFIADLSERNLRLSGYLPPFRKKNDFFWEGSPVIALDTGKFYHEKWFYENNLPTRENVSAEPNAWEDLENERKSFLPIPLIFDVDFWINLPVACDSPALGVSAALGNATLWNAGNQKRFLDNPANAVQMAVSIATIPEVRKKFELTILSLEKYQFIGGPAFNENYTHSENQIWLSANPVILDFLMWQRMNTARSAQGFEPILPEPPLFSTASKGAHSLGTCIPSELKLIRVK